jgi:hypothetical protein
MRTCQLLAAVGELCADLHGRGLWDADDQELLEAAWRFRRNYEAALSPSEVASEIQTNSYHHENDLGQ